MYSSKQINCFFCELIILIMSVYEVLPFDSDGDNNRNLSPRLVNTKYGSLRGTIVTLSSIQTSSSQSLPSIEAYLGVPYATPPVGSLRFMPPVTPTHWRGTRLANKLSPVCPQRIPFSSLIMNNSSEALKRMPLQRLEYMRKLIPLLNNQSEDCLYLNIFTPIVNQIPGSQSGPQIASTTTISNKVPVLLFIHGESYDWNSGNVYDGSILASFGQVIIVTLNYRLGILGFLPVLVDGTVRGNYGLMDQVAALHWIQENIGEFGGQPNNVTIIGHGYGAACAHLLMISPMARGLFSRVILMSGSALSPWAIARDTDLYAKNLAQALKCPNHDSIVDCLRKKKVEDILRVDLRIPDHLTAFGPIIDSIVVPSDPRKHQMPSSGNTNTKLNKVVQSVGTQYDLLFGVNRLEGPCLFTANEERHGIDTSRRDRILRTLVRNLFDFHQQAIFLTLINEYTDWSRPVEQPINILESMADILGDSLVVSPLIQTGDLHSAQTQHESSSSPTVTGKTFFYVFLHQNEESGSNKVHQRQSCSHSEELAYMFGAPLSYHLLAKSMAHFATNYSKAEVSLSEAFMTYWINFAKFGDPNIWPHDSDSSHSSSDRSLGSGSNSKMRYDNVVWPTYDPIQRKYLTIGLKPKVRDHYHSHRLSFWLNLIPRLHHPGEEQVYLRHHLLTDHENLATYDGIVRQIAFKFLAPLPTVSPSVVISATTELLHHVSTSITTEVVELTTTSISDINNPTAFPARNVNNTTSNSIIVQNGNYSTALSVTIAIGCSLLILNMLIFAGVYYQLDKNRTIAQQNNQRQKSDTASSQDESFMLSDKMDQPNVSRMTIPSPISNMMQSDCIDQSDNIYYQYKNSKYNMSNNVGNTNSLKRAQKVAVPTVPTIARKTSQDQPSQVPLPLTNDLKRIPVYIEHNSLAKEMAV